MNPTPDAVYYTTSDYAHPARRIGAALVDFVVLFLVVWLFSTGVALLVALPDVKRLSNTPEGQKQVDRQETKTQIKKSMKSIQVPAGLVAFVLLPAAYHIGLRRLRGGTPGYRVMGIRVVDRTGSTPGWRVLLRRFLIGTPMVLLLGAGYWQCPRDPKRQANHDRWSGTWVGSHWCAGSPPPRVVQSSLVQTLPSLQAVCVAAALHAPFKHVPGAQHPLPGSVTMQTV